MYSFSTQVPTNQQTAYLVVFRYVVHHDNRRAVVVVHKSPDINDGVRKWHLAHKETVLY